MQIHSNDRGVHSIKVAIQVDFGAIVCVSVGGFEVSDMLRQDGLSVVEQAKRCFQLCPHGERRWRCGKIRMQGDRRRGHAAPAAQYAGGFIVGAYQTVIQPVHDVAVMHQPSVCNVCQSTARIVVLRDLRAVCRVARGHDEGSVKLCQQ